MFIFYDFFWNLITSSMHIKFFTSFMQLNNIYDEKESINCTEGMACGNKNLR